MERTTSKGKYPRVFTCALMVMIAGAITTSHGCALEQDLELDAEGDREAISATRGLGATEPGSANLGEDVEHRYITHIHRREEEGWHDDNNKYSPWVLRHGDTYFMYYTLNRGPQEHGYNDDAIYLSIHRGDGLRADGWIDQGLVLEHGAPGSGEAQAIADPAVVVTDNGCSLCGGRETWHMYYTGQEAYGQPNDVFHAYSCNGFEFHRLGRIEGLPEETSGFGTGEPSIHFENGVFYLWYYNAHDGVGRTYLVTSRDRCGHRDFAHSFGTRPLIGVTTLHPDIRQDGDTYVFHFSQGFNRI